MKDATPPAPPHSLARDRSIFKCYLHVHKIYDAKGPENITTQWCSTGRHISAATQSPITQYMFYHC